MTIEQKFEVVRNEEEHKNNCLHKDVKELYNYYRDMGMGKKDSIRYARWTYKNLVEENEKQR